MNRHLAHALYRIGFWRWLASAAGWFGDRIDGLHADLHREPDRDCRLCQEAADEVVAEYVQRLRKP